jgi:hypothetical protein
MAGSKGKGRGVAKSVKSAERQERLAAALRENLKRRKTHARALADHAGEGPAEAAAHPLDSSPDRPKRAAKPD